MARRNDHSREQIRAMSLEAAEAILTREGVGALSVRRIAQSIGYTHGTLYLVFENLDGLLLEINRRTLDQLIACLAEAAGLAASGRTRLLALAVAYLEFARTNPERFRLVFEHRMNEGAPTPQWLGAGLRDGYTLLADALSETGMAQAAPMAATLWCTIHGATMLDLDGKLVDPEGASLDAPALLSHAVTAFSATTSNGAAI